MNSILNEQKKINLIFKLKIILFILILLLSFYRSPYIFLYGRFYAEDASVHYLNAFNSNFFGSIFFYEKFAGYFNLVANFFSYLATLVEIENAPYVIVYCSFLAIIGLPLYCLFSESYIFKTNLQKILGSLTLFISSIFTSEIWLNAVNLQVYFYFYCFLIIFMKKPNLFQKVINVILIFFSSLSGIYSCSLLPVFFGKYYLDRTKYNLSMLLIMAASCFLQLYLIILSISNQQLDSSVFTISNDLKNYSLNFLYNNVIRPFFGKDLTFYIYENYNLKIIFLFLFLLTLIIFLKNYLSIYNFFKKNKLFLIFLYCFLSINTIVFVSSLNNQVGGRYAVIPGGILLILNIYLIEISSIKSIKYFCICVSTISLLVGFHEFRPTDKNSILFRNLECVECSHWKDEVFKWKKDNSYAMKVWPQNRKRLKLHLN